MDTPSPQSRLWHDSRSMAELVGILAKDAQAPLEEPPSLETLERAIRLGAPSDKQIKDFCLGLTMLWERTQGAEWLQRALASVTIADACCWKSIEQFVSVSQSINIKQLPAWYQVTAVVKGIDYLVTVFTSLPVKQRAALEKAIGDNAGAMERLTQLLVDNLKKNKGGADCYLWLWKSKIVSRDEILGNATILMRILSKPLKGTAQKSQMELKHLLMNDDKLQRAIMRNGDPEAIQSFINMLKHASFLDRSEQQSLLVKTIRLYPAARSMVEKKAEAAESRPIGKFTSIRSFQQRSKELETIIHTKIPANARAIEHARGFGDLRENAEFKAAKDEQRLLNARRGALERSLQDVLPTDFSDVKVGSTVIPGCKVILIHADGLEETLLLLGMWDNDPENKILSYDTPLGKLLLGKTAGEAFEMPNGKTATVTTIAPLSEDIVKWVRGE